MTWASEVGWVTGQTGSVSGDIAELFVLYDGLNMSIIDLTQRVIVLEGEVLSINGTLASLPDLSGYNAIVSDVSDLLTRVGVLESWFAALPDLSGYPTLLADVAQLKLDVAAIQGTLAGLPDLSGYGALVTEVGSLRDDLTALQGTVAALPDLSGYGALVTQVGDHETRIGALESWRAVDEPEIAQLRDDVDALIGGGGGGSSTIIRLQYPSDFTPAFFGATLVEYANIGPGADSSEVTVFVYGDTANAGPVYLVAQPRVDGNPYPVRVINGRLPGAYDDKRVLLTTTTVSSGSGVTESNTAAVMPSDTGLFTVYRTPGTITPAERFEDVYDVFTETLYIEELPFGVTRVPFSAKMVRVKSSGTDAALFFRVRAVAIEGDVSDVQITSIGVRARRRFPGATPGSSFETYWQEVATVSSGSIPAGGRSFESTDAIEPINGTNGWQLIYGTDTGDLGALYLEPSGGYFDTPTTTATGITILVEFVSLPLEKYRRSSYTNIY